MLYSLKNNSDEIVGWYYLFFDNLEMSFKDWSASTRSKFPCKFLIHQVSTKSIIDTDLPMIAQLQLLFKILGYMHFLTFRYFYTFEDVSQDLIYPAFDATFFRLSIVSHFLEHQLPSSRVYLWHFNVFSCIKPWWPSGQSDWLVSKVTEDRTPPGAGKESFLFRFLTPLEHVIFFKALKYLKKYFAMLIL